MKKTEQKTMETVDETDLQILSMLRENARISLKNIAETTFLSSTAISSRIEKLEKNGYIKGYYARLNPQAFGLTIKAFINGILANNTFMKENKVAVTNNLPGASANAGLNWFYVNEAFK